MAEETFADRPQILKGDVVRFIAGETGKEVVEVVTCEIEEGTSYTPAFSFNPFFNEVLAIYRFDGRDFKCFWESRGYKLNRFEEAAAEVSAAIGNLRANVTSIAAAVQLMEQNAKEAEGKTSE